MSNPYKTAAISALAVCLALNAAGSPPTYPGVDLDQGWTSERADWYGLSQGSRILPLSWFKVLERPDGGGKFLDEPYITAFRYLWRADGSGGGMPVGFVADQTDPGKLAPPQAAHSTNVIWMAPQDRREPWVGMNCAACHTAEISYTRGDRKSVMRVDGGPTLADFQAFIAALNAALRRTISDPAAFDRFAQGVLGARDSADNRVLLRAALAHVIKRQADMERMDALPPGYRYGPGRLDAFGNIFNRLSLEVGARNPTPNPADAPVSYPYLWNVPQQSLVQWNGIAKNAAPIGAVTRNTGEALGVFSDFTARPRGWFFWNLHGYTSSVNVANLGRFEAALKTLKPPAWPSALFDDDQIDPARRAAMVIRGGAVFGTLCARCHTVVNRNDLKIHVVNQVFTLNGPDSPATDPWMACNSLSYRAKTGVLEGTSGSFLFGARMGADTPVVNLLQSTVVGSLWRQGQAVLVLVFHNIFGSVRPAPPRLPQILGVIPSPASVKAARLRTCQVSTDKNMGYKARPLNGIWATAPYLHNGSVPNLYELLLAPDARQPTFMAGSREYDPIKVGFVTDARPDNTFLFDTRLDGNSNRGHDYGVGTLTPDDRMSLIEYMKTLPPRPAARSKP